MSNTTLGILIIITFVMQMAGNILILLHLNDLEKAVERLIAKLMKKENRDDQ